MSVLVCPSPAAASSAEPLPIATPPGDLQPTEFYPVGSSSPVYYGCDGWAVLTIPGADSVGFIPLRLSRSTQAAPGSAVKIHILGARAAAGRELHHPDDQRFKQRSKTAGYRTQLQIARRELMSQVDRPL